MVMDMVIRKMRVVKETGELKCKLIKNGMQWGHPGLVLAIYGKGTMTMVPLYKNMDQIDWTLTNLFKDHMLKYRTTNSFGTTMTNTKYIVRNKDDYE